jgi:uncharacterized protein YqhQ
LSDDYPIGGQALVEGVMMRGKDSYSIALVNKSGEISVTRFEHKSISQKHKIFKVPFIRGIGALVDSLKIGVKSLMFSANEMMKEEEELRGKKSKEKSKSSEKAQGFLMAFVSIIFGFGLFVAVPNILIHLLGVVESHDPIFFNVLSGAMRIMFFVGYVFAISLMKDVRRVFQYHGAEHKAVNAYENGKEVNVEEASKFTTFHPRCGTSFMFFVLLIAIVVFSFVPLGITALWPEFKLLHVVIRKSILIFSHILLLPIVAGISYETIKLTYKGRANIFLKMLSLPGYGIQKITTREPDETMIKCAVEALNDVLNYKKEKDRAEEAA